MIPIPAIDLREIPGSGNKVEKVESRRDVAAFPSVLRIVSLRIFSVYRTKFLSRGSCPPAGRSVGFPRIGPPRIIRRNAIKKGLNGWLHLKNFICRVDQ